MRVVVCCFSFADGVRLIFLFLYSVAHRHRTSDIVRFNLQNVRFNLQLRGQMSHYFLKSEVNVRSHFRWSRTSHQRVEPNPQTYRGPWSSLYTTCGAMTTARGGLDRCNKTIILEILRRKTTSKSKRERGRGKRRGRESGGDGEGERERERERERLFDAKQ